MMNLKMIHICYMYHHQVNQPQMEKIMLLHFQNMFLVYASKKYNINHNSVLESAFRKKFNLSI